ncbi:uncharacterized protein LOC128556098 [Mercenaria mercenaria]|uniref:uncharacterized protein LOC128556098 n=1 Tax=Mercenaria mercenaria TaxID=6596 RepID=UPI00234EFD47|nr:uncharacterized protein LOC128556098 [Mercenaria mercenaria]
MDLYIMTIIMIMSSRISSFNSGGVSGDEGGSSIPRTCDISGAAAGVEIISPSANDGSRIICYTQGDAISSCQSRIYLAVKSGSNPKIDVETKSELKSHITIGPVTKSTVLPGISTMFSTDVTINGTMNSTKLQYFCVHASVGLERQLHNTINFDDICIE